MKEVNIKQIQQFSLQMLKEAIRICESHNIPYYACFGTVLGAVRHQGYIPWDHDTDICIPIDDLNNFVKYAKEELNEQFDILIPGEVRNPVLFARLCLKGYNSLVLHLDVYAYVGMPNEKKKQERFLMIFNKLSNIYTIKKVFKIKRNGNLLQIVKSYLIRLYLMFFNIKKLEKKNQKLSLMYPVEESNFVCIPYVPVYGNRKIWEKSLLGNGILTQFEDIEIRIPEKYDTYLKLIYGNYMEYPPKEDREYMLNKVFKLEKN